MTLIELQGDVFIAKNVFAITVNNEWVRIYEDGNNSFGYSYSCRDAAQQAFQLIVQQLKQAPE